MAAQTTNGNPLTALAPLLLLGLVFYFLLIRPQQRKAKQQQALVRSVEVGDEVVTSGGIFGHIVAIDDDEDVVTLEIADGVEIHILRGGIGRKIESYEDDYEDDDDRHEAADSEAEPGHGDVVADDQPDQTKDL